MKGGDSNVNRSDDIPTSNLGNGFATLRDIAIAVSDQAVGGEERVGEINYWVAEVENRMREERKNKMKVGEDGQALRCYLDASATWM